METSCDKSDHRPVKATFTFSPGSADAHAGDSPAREEASAAALLKVEIEALEERVKRLKKILRKLEGHDNN